MKIFILFITVIFCAQFHSLAQTKADIPSSIKLVQPELEKGKTVMMALKNRKSEREFGSKDLSLQHISEILWAANGINREDGKRTAPSAMNKHTVDVYLVSEEGVYFYDPLNHELTLSVVGDHRAITGRQNFVSEAPVNLLYIADYSKYSDMSLQLDEKSKLTWVCLDAGHMAENVYLYCASEEIAIVTRGMVQKEELAKVLKLKPEQEVIMAQTIGYRK